MPQAASPRRATRAAPAIRLSPARSSRSAPGHAGYRCSECGAVSARWGGRCGQCQAWGTVIEVDAPPAGRTAPGPVSAPACRISDVDVDRARARPTGLGELDRVLGGGLVPGAVVLLAGEPGVGKSTLLLEVAAQSARSGTVLYVSGEESAAQVRLRAERIGAVHPELYLAAETDLAAVLGHVEEIAPALLVVDSVQTVSSAEVDGSAGGVAQVREVAAALIRVAKSRGLPTLLVGHVTKDGSVAGPRVLEHLVDVVLTFEGDRHARLRMIRATKNRYGATDEVGCFDLGDSGLVELADPSALFRTSRTEPVPGTCVTVTLEGRRPLVAEVQALVALTTMATPRRAVSGLDASRTAMVLAVLTRRAGVQLADRETYLATVGGVRLGEPAADLAVAVALASARYDAPVPTDIVAFGEVGLAGDVRPVAGIHRRLAEAARLGFRRALVPVLSGPAARDVATVSRDLRVMPVPDVRSALLALGLAPARSDA